MKFLAVILVDKLFFLSHCSDDADELAMSPLLGNYGSLGHIDTPKPTKAFSSGREHAVRTFSQTEIVRTVGQNPAARKVGNRSIVRTSFGWLSRLCANKNPIYIPRFGILAPINAHVRTGGNPVRGFDGRQFDPILHQQTPVTYIFFSL